MYEPGVHLVRFGTRAQCKRGVDVTDRVLFTTLSTCMPRAPTTKTRPYPAPAQATKNDFGLGTCLAVQSIASCPFSCFAHDGRRAWCSGLVFSILATDAALGVSSISFFSLQILASALLLPPYLGPKTDF
jgi:hypothetical protein